MIKILYSQFCWCGKPLYYMATVGNTKIFCMTHKEDYHEKPVKKLRGRFSGESKSENKFNDYK